MIQSMAETEMIQSMEMKGMIVFSVELKEIKSMLETEMILFLEEQIMMY